LSNHDPSGALPAGQKIVLRSHIQTRYLFKRLILEGDYMKISKTFLVTAVVLTLAGFACQEMQATPTPIAGLLNITGSAPGPNGASARPGFFGAAVDDGTNGYFDIMQKGTPVSIASPSMFFDSSVVASSLWSVGGFTLELGNPIHDGNKIVGTATIFAPGLQPISGVEWIYTSRIGGTFAFQLISGISDSGTTILLLGLALVTIAVCRPKFAKS
jgi:hypothetical protein